MSFPTKYWKPVNESVKCLICPHCCVLKPGESGLCRTHRNENGKLVTLAYGNPVALNIDPIEKKPLYHFFPGSKTFSFSTRGCNLRCLNCQNYHISQAAPSNEDAYLLEPVSLVKSAIEQHCASISYTYTDPVAFFEYATETAQKSKEAGLLNVIVSAGYIRPKPLQEWCSCMDAANIDLKVFDDGIYQKLNGVRLKPMLKTLNQLKKANVWLEITNLLIPGWTDSLSTIEKMCIWLVRNGFQDTPVHFSRFYPTYKLKDVPPTPVRTIEMAYEIAKSTGINYVYSGNLPGHDADNTYCPYCKEKIIERNGFNISSINLKNNCCKYCGHSIAGRFI